MVNIALQVTLVLLWFAHVTVEKSPKISSSSDVVVPNNLISISQNAGCYLCSIAIIIVNSAKLYQRNFEQYN